MKARKADSLETRVAVLESTIVHINETLNRIELRLHNLDVRIDKMNDRISSHFRWIIGAIVITFGSPLFIESLKLIKGV